MKLGQSGYCGMEKEEVHVIFLKDIADLILAEEAFRYCDLIQGISLCFCFCFFIR